MLTKWILNALFTQPDQQQYYVCIYEYMHGSSCRLPAVHFRICDLEMLCLSRSSLLLVLFVQWEVSDESGVGVLRKFYAGLGAVALSTAMGKRRPKAVLA